MAAMQRILIPVLFLVLACRALLPGSVNAPASFTTQETPGSRPSQTADAAIATGVEAPDQPSAFPVTPTPAPVKHAPLPTPQPAKPFLPTDAPFQADFHPDGPHYVGDQVSLEVIASQDAGLEGSRVVVGVDGRQLGEEGGARFEPFGIAGRSQVTLLWFWDTTEFVHGDHDVAISVLPDGPTWTETISLLPREDLPPPEPWARWARTESECCLVYYITGTAAERDLAKLVAMVDQQYEKANQVLDVEMDEPVTITFLPRVIGHGGFAQGEISVVYTDRNYAGSKPQVVTHHEIVHVLDAKLGGEMRPTMLVEGLAVYLTGGHFKDEALVPRAAALLPPADGCRDAAAVQAGTSAQLCSLDWFQSLVELADDFYFAQHETSYLQAGALVAFMVETWGWEAFSHFYRDIQPVQEPPQGIQLEGGSQALAIDTALREHFHTSLGGLEELFIQFLEEEILAPEAVEDVRLSVQYYESVRRYQQWLDPSAYFLTAWLPLGDQMRARSIVADYLRRPAETENLVLETMLASANMYLLSGEYEALDEILVAVNEVMELVSRGAPEPFNAHPMAADYRDLVHALQEAGYQPVKIRIEDTAARAWVNATGVDLQQVPMIRTQNGWAIGLQAGYSPAITD